MIAVKSLLAFLVLGLAIAGCKDDEGTTDPPTNQPVTYVGTIANGTESGSISMTVAPSKSTGINSGVTGTLTIVSPSDTTITLTGTFTTDTLAVTGGAYAFDGTLAGGSISGDYTGPNGPGQFSAQPSTNNSVTVYAGTYTSSTISGNFGTFNIVINGTVITGFSVDSGSGESTTLTGTLTGNNISILGGLAVGTLAGTTVSGTYNNGSGDQGTWSGELVP
ncbi:MAG: hypothetical protein ACKVRP_00005 [Bacteroidota bacterium]